MLSQFIAKNLDPGAVRLLCSCLSHFSHLPHLKEAQHISEGVQNIQNPEILLSSQPRWKHETSAQLSVGPTGKHSPGSIPSWSLNDSTSRNIKPLAITELNPVETGHSPPIKLINVLKTQSQDSWSGKWNYQMCVIEFRFPFSPVVELLQLACIQGKNLSNSMEDLLQIHWAEELPSFLVEFH